MSDLVDLLEAQLQLQKEHMKDGDPRNLSGDALADFMRWNAFALEDEIHEAMAEVGWKPWATSRHVNDDAFLAEMVDAFHFFMNMLLAGLGQPPGIIAERFKEAYYKKNQRNAERQQEGYTGLDKCPTCHRDLHETRRVMATWTNPETNQVHCSKGCALGLKG